MSRFLLNDKDFKKYKSFIITVEELKSQLNEI